MMASRVLRLVPEVRFIPPLAGSVRTIILAAFFAILILPQGGYVLVKDQYHKTVPHDLYKLPMTPMQDEQLAYIRAHIPTNSRIIMDDDLWVQLHDVKPYYPLAHSHWKASSDPAVRDRLFNRDWRNIDYVVMSNKMLIAMRQNNTGGSEDYILAALQHATPIWQLTRGDVSLAIYQVQK
jgi:hypothetical protein